MTREEFKKKVDKISCYLSSPTLDDLHEIDDHDAEQRQVIEDLQKRVEELIDRRNNFHYEAVEWRGIEFDNVCTECTGSGYTVYGNTTTYHRGAGGQAITTSVCNICWGSGDKSRPWTSWLKIEGIQRQLELLKTDDAEQRAEIARLREALNVWQSLFRQAVNVAGGLTNYVDDRPELHHAERRIKLLEQQAKQSLKETIK